MFERIGRFGCGVELNLGEMRLVGLLRSAGCGSNIVVCQNRLIRLGEPAPRLKPTYSSSVPTECSSANCGLQPQASQLSSRVFLHSYACRITRQPRPRPQTGSGSSLHGSTPLSTLIYRLEPIWSNGVVTRNCEMLQRVRWRRVLGVVDEVKSRFGHGLRSGPRAPA